MIDLHLHSTYSDGTHAPLELVEMAARKGLSAIAITDHDTAEGVSEGADAGRRFGVRFVSGIELSVFLEESHFHLLGYGFDSCDVTLQQGLKKLQDSREDRNRQIIAKLQGLGLPVSESEVLQLSGRGQTGRPHIARMLVGKKVVKSIDQAFKLYLRRGACAYVSRFIFNVEEAIGLIHGAGGIAVLAHPTQISDSIETLERLAARLVPLGLDGLETYYPTQRGPILRKLKGLAMRYDLIETGGSDYHGEIRPGTSMAGGSDHLVPDELIGPLEARLERLKDNRN